MRTKKENKMIKPDWITQDMYNEKIKEIINELGTNELLKVPGVYDLVSEYYNDTAVEELEEERKK